MVAGAPARNCYRFHQHRKSSVPSVTSGLVERRHEIAMVRVAIVARSMAVIIAGRLRSAWFEQIVRCTRSCFGERRDLTFGVSRHPRPITKLVRGRKIM
jgi:hypothetical protein